MKEKWVIVQHCALNNYKIMGKVKKPPNLELMLMPWKYLIYI